MNADLSFNVPLLPGFPIWLIWYPASYVQPVALPLMIRLRFVPESSLAGKCSFMPRLSIER